MKRILAFIIVACLAVFVFIPVGNQSVSAAETSVFDREDNEIYLILEDFVQTHPKRQAFSQEEKAAADYIAERFVEEGLADVKQTTFNYGMDSSQNVSGRIPAAQTTARTVIIGAHYDNDVYGASDGTFDNGGGVAALIYIARKLAGASLPFNVEIVAFGAEEAGMVGSYFYAAQTLDAENTMLFINIDMIAGGDMLYAYGEDVKTDFEDFFVKISEKEGVSVPLKNKPANKRVPRCFGAAPDGLILTRRSTAPRVGFRSCTTRRCAPSAAMSLSSAARGCAAVQTSKTVSSAPASAVTV